MLSCTSALCSRTLFKVVDEKQSHVLYNLGLSATRDDQKILAEPNSQQDRSETVSSTPGEFHGFVPTTVSSTVAASSSPFDHAS